MPRPLLALLIALAAAAALSAYSDHFDAYYLDVAIGIGINLILAVSLNLVKNK